MAEEGEMAKSDDIVDHKARTHLDGVGKVVNESAWGEQKAVDRGYCRGTQHPDMRSGEETGEGPQKLGDQNNLQDKNYKNDTPNDWRRGGGQGGESRPYYGPTYRAPRGEPGQNVDPHSTPRMGYSGPHYTDRPPRSGYGPNPTGGKSAPSPFSTAGLQQKNRQGGTEGQ
jgi:hypothetical protein